MILDTSVLIAILKKEPDAVQLAAAIASATGRRLSAASYLEAGLVIDGLKDPVLSRRLDELIAGIGATIEPVTASQAVIARAAYRDFGRGSGHQADLNYGDCFSYALAKEKDEPLLFTGHDFSHTDVKVVRY